MKPIRDNLFALHYSDQQDLWFRKSGNKKLIVFLHGMYSTPSTFEDYAARWTQKNPEWDVYCPALPAGTKDTEILAQLGPWTWNESIAVAGEKFRKSAEGYDTVILGGHSQGGSLSLAIAPNFNFIKAVIIIASPLYLGGKTLSWDENFGIYIADLLCLLAPKGIYKAIGHTKRRQALEKHCDAEGLVFPLTISTFKKGLRQMRPRLKEITVPLFMSYCMQDTLVDFGNAERLAAEVGSKLVVRKVFDIPKKKEPYGRKHQLLNYTETREGLSSALDDFLSAF